VEILRPFPALSLPSILVASTGVFSVVEMKFQLRIQAQDEGDGRVKRMRGCVGIEDLPISSVPWGRRRRRSIPKNLEGCAIWGSCGRILDVNGMLM
jgi:hypothetical protein